MRRRVAWCWTLMLLAAAFCDVAAGKGGRGGARGSARGRARGAARSRPRALPRYGGALRVAAAAAAGGAAAGAALQRARLAGGPDDGIEYREGNGTAGAWTSVAPGWAAWGQVASWLCPLAALLHRLVA
ncbi:shadow of prion protein [Anser cygnoides]|uniref:shadow of prion protein n=1 Tax=Cygnus atratus TaxID=8868 RepID=UPI0015D5A49E|nr:shadow of prion protein [Cygnus atratus]